MNSFRNSLLLHRTILQQNSTRNFARRVFAPNVTRVYNKNESNEKKSTPPLHPINDDSEDVFWREQKQNFNKNKTKPRNFLDLTIKKQQEIRLPEYIKSEQSHNDFRKMMLNLSIKKRRDNMNKIVLEGKRLINDAINANVHIESIYFTTENFLSEIHDLDRIVNQDGTKLVRVLYKDMKLFSSLVNSPGCMAVCEKPNKENIKSDNNNDPKMPITLICDNIRDPGNMGTIIRTCAASNIKELITTTGCCDIWNSKVIQASTGANFRIPIIEKMDWLNLADTLPKNEANFYFTDSSIKSDSKSYFELDPFDSESSREKFLIISNEAHGPSKSCQEFMQKLSPSNCTKIHIPLGSSVESLNVAIVTSILLFEFRKQFYLKNKKN